MIGATILVSRGYMKCGPALCREIVGKVSHSTEEQIQWQRDLKRGKSDAWHGLLLLLVNNLRRLYVASPDKYFWRVIQRAVDREKPFNAMPGFILLQEVEISCYPLTSSTLLPLFRFPSMRVLRCKSVCDPNDDESGKHPSQLPLSGTSTIRHLELTWSASNYAVRDLISSCANLECFEFDSSGQMGELFEPLSLAKKNLRSLWNIRNSRFPESSWRDMRFRSLADFSELREIRLPLESLLDISGPGDSQVGVGTSLVEILPPLVEWLCLMDCKREQLATLIPGLHGLVSVKNTRVPFLARLDIEGSFISLPTSMIGREYVSSYY